MRRRPPDPFLLAVAALLSAAPWAMAETTPPKLAERAASPESFAPAGWSIEARASGDLDGDGRADAAFVLRPTASAPTAPTDAFRIDGNPKILAVALARGDSLALAVQTASFIRPHESHGAADSFEGSLKIERGTLEVFLDLLPGAGSWHGSRTFRFRLEDGTLSLIGFDSADVERGSGQMTETSVNYLTGRMSRSKGSIASDAGGKKVWSRIKAKRPPTIEELGDAIAFDPTN